VKKVITEVHRTVPNFEVEVLPNVQNLEPDKITQVPFDVRLHIRNLHPGWNASAEKLVEAKAMGITLLPGQTLVDEYTKGYTVA